MALAATDKCHPDTLLRHLLDALDLEPQGLIKTPSLLDRLDGDTYVLDAIDHFGRTEHAAGTEGADARAQEPGEAADVIDVSVRQDDLLVLRAEPADFAPADGGS